MLNTFHRSASSLGSLLSMLVGAVMWALPAIIAPTHGGEDVPETSLGAAAHGASDPGTVLITGANRGIGLEFAKEYRDAGWHVIATAREPDKAQELKALGEGVSIVALDVTSAESVAALAKSLDGKPIDLLVNNAGVGVGLDGGPRLADLKIDEFERVMRVNAIGPVRVTQALLPNLRAGKGKVIVGITSGLGSIAANGQGGFYGYRESKAALDMFVRSVAAELKGEGFICIAMAPGWVKTDMGGPNAELTPEESVSGMRKVIEGLKPEDSGKFWTHDGKKMPW
jgi:NAD(P)-dependent dehydrogenase (short-subunit alcohol dehydrogenase family)